ncbi:hypothetical protein BdWA1_000642 [Babesia duncani]|uniref:Uncharacterized protein n=1 Tax=Babesia duncani TaxID=323732 RepID=A0AAD9PMJ5_9APIC|nr:hypothetical protein BdWA1_000642 [Babesia duncani]
MTISKLKSTRESTSKMLFNFSTVSSIKNINIIVPDTIKVMNSDNNKAIGIKSPCTKFVVYLINTFNIPYCLICRYFEM